MRHLVVLCMMFWVVHAQVKRTSAPIVSFVMHKPETDPLAKKMAEVCEAISPITRRSINRRSLSHHSHRHHPRSKRGRKWQFVKSKLSTFNNGLEKKFSTFNNGLEKNLPKIQTALSAGHLALDTYKTFNPNVPNANDNNANAANAAFIQSYVIEKEVKRQLEQVAREPPVSAVDKHHDKIKTDDEHKDEIANQLLYNHIVKGSIFSEAIRKEHKLTSYDYYQVKIRECGKEKLTDELFTYRIVAEMVMSDLEEPLEPSTARAVPLKNSAFPAHQKIVTYFISFMTLRHILLLP